MAQEQDTLNPSENALDTIRSIHGWPETETRSFLSKYLFTGDDVFTPVGLMSFGERARLMLACSLPGVPTCYYWMNRSITWISPPGCDLNRRSKNLTAPSWLLCMTGILSITSPQQIWEIMDGINSQ